MLYQNCIGTYRPWQGQIDPGNLYWDRCYFHFVFPRILVLIHRGLPVTINHFNEVYFAKIVSFWSQVSCQLHFGPSVLGQSLLILIVLPWKLKWNCKYKQLCSRSDLDCKLAKFVSIFYCKMFLFRSLLGNVVAWHFTSFCFVFVTAEQQLCLGRWLNIDT